MQNIFRVEVSISVWYCNVGLEFLILISKEVHSVGKLFEQEVFDRCFCSLLVYISEKGNRLIDSFSWTRCSSCSFQLEFKYTIKQNLLMLYGNILLFIEDQSSSLKRFFFPLAFGFIGCLGAWVVFFVGKISS